MPAEITPVHAAGMLIALQREHSHNCQTHTTTAVLGGVEKHLRCPLALLSIDSESDRRTIASIYAFSAREAMGRAL